ncbi:MAG TPA: hypothetical protein VG818_02700, partial [Gemmatimonadaceae bacterium]|nr:hypothetical protein [Gemmatimonadaceae bacterium]
AQLTADAFAAQHALEARGLVEGELIQHLSWLTGDPALSAGGTRVAIVLRSATRPARTVVWSTAPEPPDTGAQRARARMLARDPEDVAARASYPRAKKVLATLRAVNGHAYTNPRFMPDSRHVLVTRMVTAADGSTQPDLFMWDTQDGGVVRITHAAGVRDADPLPDGRSAIATRCAGGTCDVVRVDLATGVVRTVLAGAIDHAWYRPRVSPDGTRFVASESGNDAWRLRLFSIDGTPLPLAGLTDDANRFDASFRPTGDTLVYVSDAGGVMNIAELDLRSGHERALTRVTGAAVAPVVSAADGSVWFLSLHARGYDVRRLAAGQAADSTVSLAGAFGAAAPPSRALRDTFPTNIVSRPASYALGPRHTRWLPSGVASADGTTLGIALANSDIVGRWTSVATAALGARSAWNGAALASSWRGWRLPIDVALHAARQRPSLGSLGGLPGTALDESRAGGVLATGYQSSGDRVTWRARAGVGGERVAALGTDTHYGRSVAFAEWSGSISQSGDGWRAWSTLSARASAGASDGVRTQAFLARAAAGGASHGWPLTASFAYGRASGGRHPDDGFVLGGAPMMLVDSALTMTRTALPWLPTSAGSDASFPNHLLLIYRVMVPIGIVEPFYEGASVSAGPGPRAWHRGLGVEAHANFPPFAGAYVPASEIRFGVARSIDPPFAARTTVFALVRVSP